MPTVSLCSEISDPTCPRVLSLGIMPYLIITIIIITEICIAPFPEVNQIKGALQKIEKQFTQTAL